MSQQQKNVKSTLVEPPPDSEGLDEESVEFIRADSVRELAEKTNLGNDDVLDRVLLPGKRFGPYHILGFVAAGGMGEIYAAERIKSDGSRSRPVALKVITDEFSDDWKIIERFKREARISKAIRSRHVARVYEFGESPGGQAFLAMELLNGEELFDRLYRHTVLSAMTVAELTLQILKGLHEIHKSGFVHRDIKPENIFLAQDQRTEQEEVKIIDFGVAKRADEKSDPLLSVAGQIYGTPQYIAPEQAVNPDVDQRADLYSLGVVMYECVTGNLPFQGESSYDVIVAHQQKEVPRLPSSIDPAFADIIYQAMAKTPDERFQSAVEMGRVLKRWVDETSWVEETSEPSQPVDPHSHIGAASVDRRDEDGELNVDEAAEDLRARAEGRHADPARMDTRLDDAAVDAPPMLSGGQQSRRQVDTPPPNLQTGQSEAPPADLETAPTAVASTDSPVFSDTPPPTLAEPDADRGPSRDQPEDETTSAPGQTSTPQPQPPSTDDGFDLDPSAQKSDSPASSSTAKTGQPPRNQQANESADASNGEEKREELSPPSEITTELRNPRNKRDDETSDTDTRTAQIITGIALGVLILAIGWALFL